MNDDANSFIIELVSNASVDIFPDNTLASFTNFLPKQLVLEGEWEVALMEVGYSTWINNVTTGSFRYVSKIQNDDNIEYSTELKDYSIPSGFYRSTSELFDAMKNEARKAEDPPLPLMTVDPFDQRVQFTWKSSESVLNLASADIANMLGFPSPCIVPAAIKKSPLPADLVRMHSIMMYTDIVEHGIIGNAMAPLLRCFPIRQKLRNNIAEVNQSMEFISFSQLQFRRVLKNHIHSIKVELRSETGELIPFNGIGMTRMTILFRKCN